MIHKTANEPGKPTWSFHAFYVDIINRLRWTFSQDLFVNENSQKWQRGKTSSCQHNSHAELISGGLQLETCSIKQLMPLCQIKPSWSLLMKVKSIYNDKFYNDSNLNLFSRKTYTWRMVTTQVWFFTKLHIMIEAAQNHTGPRWTIMFP